MPEDGNQGNPAPTPRLLGHRDSCAGLGTYAGLEVSGWRDDDDGLLPRISSILKEEL